MASVRVLARRCVCAAVPIPRAVVAAAVRVPVTGLLALSALAWLAALMAGNHQPIAQPRPVVMSAALTASPLGGDDGDNGGGCGGGFGCGGGISSGWAAPGSALSDSGGLSQIPVKTSGAAWHPNDPTGSGVSPRRDQPGAAAAVPPESSGGSGITQAGMARILGQLSELMPQIGRLIGRATTPADAGNVGDAGEVGGSAPPGTARRPDTSGAADQTGAADRSESGAGSLGEVLARAGMFAIGRASGTAGTVGMTPPGATGSGHLSADGPTDQLGTGGASGPGNPWATPATTNGRSGGRLSRADPTTGGGSDAGGTPAPSTAGAGADDWSPGGARGQSLTDTADPAAGARTINDRLGSLTGPRGPDPSDTGSVSKADLSDVDPSTAPVPGGGRAGMAVPTSDGGTLGITPTDTPSGHASVTPDEANNRYLITAQDPQAPNDYHFHLSMPQGSSAQPNRDGGVDVVNPAGRTTQTIAAPWAHDATGAPVPTHFTVAGNTLTQHIDPGPDSVYPIIADPAAKGGGSSGGSGGGKGGGSGGGKSGGSSGGGKSGGGKSGGGSSSSGSSSGSSSHGGSAKSAAHSGSGGTDSSSTASGSHGHSTANAAHSGSGGTTSGSTSPGSAGASGRSASNAARSGSGGTQTSPATAGGHAVSAANATRSGTGAPSDPGGTVPAGRTTATTAHPAGNDQGGSITTNTPAANATTSSGTLPGGRVAPAPGDNAQPGQPGAAHPDTPAQDPDLSGTALGGLHHDPSAATAGTLPAPGTVPAPGHPRSAGPTEQGGVPGLGGFPASPTRAQPGPTDPPALASPTGRVPSPTDPAQQGQPTGGIPLGSRYPDNHTLSDVLGKGWSWVDHNRDQSRQTLGLSPVIDTPGLANNANRDLRGAVGGLADAPVNSAIAAGHQARAHPDQVAQDINQFGPIGAVVGVFARSEGPHQIAGIGQDAHDIAHRYSSVKQWASDYYNHPVHSFLQDVQVPLAATGARSLLRAAAAGAAETTAREGAQALDTPVEPPSHPEPDTNPAQRTPPVTPPTSPSAPASSHAAPTGSGAGHNGGAGDPIAPTSTVDPTSHNPAQHAPTRTPQLTQSGIGARSPPATETRPTQTAVGKDTDPGQQPQLLDQLDSTLPTHAGRSADELGLSPAQRAALPDAVRDNPGYTYFEDHRGNGYLRRTPTRPAHDQQLPSIPQITNELGPGAGERGAAGESENRGDPAHGNAGIDRSTEEPGNAHDVAAAAAETRTPRGQVDPDALARFTQTLPSLDADSAGGLDNALTDFTNSAVGREGLTLEKLAGGGAQGISGAPVYLAKDADNNVVAITKVFPKVSELAQEMSALDKLSSDEFQRFHTPDVLGAAAVDQPAGTQGALVMSLAKGQSLDDVIKNFRTSTDKAGAWQQAKNAVADSARALAELHSRSAEPGRTMTEPYMENHQRTARNAATSMAGKHADVLRSAGIDPNTLPARIDELFDAARADPGPASVVHGDAHAGNIFWAPGEQGSASGQVTFIDAGLGHFSMDQSGRAIGTAARDTAKLERWLDRYSLRGFDPDQANELRDTFVGAYRDAGGPAVSEATSKAFTARYALLSSLGEADNLTRPGINTRTRRILQRQLDYELDTLRRASER